MFFTGFLEAESEDAGLVAPLVVVLEGVESLEVVGVARLGLEEVLGDPQSAGEEVSGFASHFGHLQLLIGKPSTKECLEKAIEGETYEFTDMYPSFERQAKSEGDAIALQEFQNQILESSEHAEQFKQVLAKAELRFKALKGVEERHAQAYKQVLEGLHG